MQSITDELRQQLKTVREERATSRRQRFTRSRLDRYRAELELLAEEGASLRDMAAWLRRFKRVKVHPTTVSRRLAFWGVVRSQTPAED